MENIKEITPHRDINDALYFLARGIRDIFGDELVGFYLTGSLSYGDFEEGRSDIDLAVILKRAALPAEIEFVRKLHADAEQKYSEWSKRIECSYIPLGMLANILPPKEPRPYVGGGIFYAEINYGNEWIINQYFLYKYGIALIGPDFKTLVEPIDFADVRRACVRDLRKEWEPKINDKVFLADSHQQSYVVINLCRILYAVKGNDAVSKKVAVSWAKKEYPQWKELIETADSWRYGTKMERQPETIEFIKFVIAEIN